MYSLKLHYKAIALQLASDPFSLNELESAYCTTCHSETYDAKGQGLKCLVGSGTNVHCSPGIGSALYKCPWFFVSDIHQMGMDCFIWIWTCTSSFVVSIHCSRRWEIKGLPVVLAALSYAFKMIAINFQTLERKIWLLLRPPRPEPL